MSSTADKPTIVFVPGAWHGPAGFDVVRSQLQTLGYPSEAVAHPSIGEEPPTKNLVDDSAVLRAAIERLAEQGKQVVVVAHSYGGVVVSCAVEGLGRRQRKTEGKEGGVIQVAFMSAFAIPKDTCLLDALGGNWLPWMQVTGDYCHSSDPENVFYHDLSPSEQHKWIAQLSHSATAVFSGKSTYEPWRDIPCSYIFCDQDRAIPLFAQEGIAKGMGSEVTTFHIDSSHSPFLSAPEKLVEGIEVVAKAGQEKAQVGGTYISGYAGC